MFEMTETLWQVIEDAAPGARFFYGASRLVFLTADLAIKVPRGECGRRCNQFEAAIWNHYRDHPRGQYLCPVLWAEPEGKLLIMPRADPLTDAAYLQMREKAFDWWDYRPAERVGFPWEHKREDWGLIEGRTVCLDYSAPALFL